MREEQHQFLTVRHLPFRLTAEQVAWLLNCHVQDIPILVAAKVLKPLANPIANSTKYFATTELLENMKDRQWLVRVTGAIYQYTQRKNARQKDMAVVGKLTLG